MKLISTALGAALLAAPCVASAQAPQYPLYQVQFLQDQAARPDVSKLVAQSRDASPSTSSVESITLAGNTLPEAPSAGFAGVRIVRPPLAVASNTTLFSAYALELSFGTGGIGLDLATVLNSRFNLRAGAGFFSYTTSFTVDSIPIDGTLHLGNVHAGVDWFIFGNSFHISPGFTVYNNTNYNARIFIPGNQIVTLNDQDYTSDPSDPIHGTALITFGNKVAPRLTFGRGNMLPHKDKNWTFPLEAGVEYRSAPTANFQLAGSSCDSTGDCGPIQQDPSTQANILAQQQQIVQEIRPLRFFPVFSFGIAYKFGH